MTVQPIVTTPGSGGEWTEVKWGGLMNGDTGQPVSAAGFQSITGAAYGVFGTGGNVTLEMTPDGGTTWFAIDGSIGGIPATTSGLIFGFAGFSLLRPRVTAGDGTTALTVYLFLTGKGASS